MYRYKFVEIPHSVWNGKPKERIELIVEEYANKGWRLVQILQSSHAVWYSGRVKSFVIFEKPEEAMEFSEKETKDEERDFV